MHCLVFWGLHITLKLNCKILFTIIIVIQIENKVSRVICNNNQYFIILWLICGELNFKFMKLIWKIIIYLAKYLKYIILPQNIKYIKHFRLIVAYRLSIISSKYVQYVLCYWLHKTRTPWLDGNLKVNQSDGIISRSDFSLGCC